VGDWPCPGTDQPNKTDCKTVWIRNDLGKFKCPDEAHTVLLRGKPKPTEPKKKQTAKKGTQALCRFDAREPGKTEMTRTRVPKPASSKSAKRLRGKRKKRKTPQEKEKEETIPREEGQKTWGKTWLRT